MLGHEVRHRFDQLLEAGRGPRLVEVDQLVSAQAEDLAEVGAIAPRRDQIADAGQ